MTGKFLIEKDDPSNGFIAERYSIGLKDGFSRAKKIIDVAINYEEGPEKDALVHAIANHLKKSYLNWNRESVADDLIFQHLESLSSGRLQLKDELRLNTTNDILSRNKKKVPVKPTKPGRSGKYSKPGEYKKTQNPKMMRKKKK